LSFRNTSCIWPQTKPGPGVCAVPGYWALSCFQELEYFKILTEGRDRGEREGKRKERREKKEK
jgi:hypothetical protein